MNKNSKSVRILDILEATGEKGMRFTDIQEALWTMSHTRNFHAPYRSFLANCMVHRPNRGYWCTNLLGGTMYHAGLLRTFAIKGDDGRWRRNNVPHNNKPWSVVNGR